MTKLNYHRLLGYLAYLLHRSMVKALADDFEKEQKEVSVDQYRALCSIIDFPGNTQNWLAERLIQNKSYISRLSESMERSGYIRRVRIEGEGNQYQLTATRSGEEIAQQCFDIAVRINKDACKGITAAEFQIFRDVMLKILRNLNKGRTF